MIKKWLHNKSILPILLLVGIAAVAYLLTNKGISYQQKQQYAHQFLYAHLYRLSNSIDENTIVFLGSSTIQAMPVGQTLENTMNLGVGGEKLIPLSQRIQAYQRLDTAKAIVVMAGFNDICEGGDEAYQRFLQFYQVLPANVPLILLGLQPATAENLCPDLSAKIDEYNAALAVHCTEAEHCTFADVRRHFIAAPESIKHYFEDDGIHFNRKGYMQLLEQITPLIKTIH